jgi:anaerobic magnesium-protoporphyrin IX monomethyl ester cyclase
VNNISNVKSSKSSVCFITPPSPFLLDERVFPALGILKVAAVAEQLGHRVSHLDLNGVENYTDVIEQFCIEQPDIDVFAVTATTPQMVGATRILRAIRRYAPTAKTVIGGPHPTLVHAAFQKAANERALVSMADLVNNWDVVVAGDGEYAIKDVLRKEFTAGLINADDVSSAYWVQKDSLAELPLPARHLVDMSSYHYEIDNVPVTPLIAQLGCPYGCNFCAGRDSAMLRRTRIKPVSAILDELEHLYTTYGYRGFMYFDDELNINHTAAMDLFVGMERLQQRLGVEFRARGFVKSNLFNEDQAAAMYRAGFRRVMCGFESGSDKILKNINKRATKDQNTRAMEISHKYGLDMKALMSVGHPGESHETIEETLTWLKQVRPADFDVTIITAYPGSPYYDRAEKIEDETRSSGVGDGVDAGDGGSGSHGSSSASGSVWMFETDNERLYMRDLDYTKIADFYKGGIGDYKSYVWTDYIGPSELVAARDIVEREVRLTLGVPFYKAQASTRFESSMGMLPGSVYRESSKAKGA